MCSPCPSHAFSVGPFRQGTQTCNTCDRSLPYVILSGGHRPIPATSRREGSQDDGLETGCQGLGRPPLSKHRFAGLSGGSFRPAATGMGRRCGLQDDNVHGQVSHTCGSWMLLGNGPPMNARGRGGAHTRVILRFDSLSVGARFIAPAIPTRRACHPRATRPPTLPDAPAILARPRPPGQLVRWIVQHARNAEIHDACRWAAMAYLDYASVVRSPRWPSVSDSHSGRLCAVIPKPHLNNFSSDFGLSLGHTSAGARRGRTPLGRPRAPTLRGRRIRANRE